MARPLRIEYAGACYHVMNRGNRRQTVFTARKEYELFLERLGLFAGRFRWTCWPGGLDRCMGVGRRACSPGRVQIVRRVAC